MFQLNEQGVFGMFSRYLTLDQISPIINDTIYLEQNRIKFFKISIAFRLSFIIHHSSIDYLIPKLIPNKIRKYIEEEEEEERCDGRSCFHSQCMDYL